eukprot:TRINITY_DN10812_c0_g1_i2.p1 TRINITY_DN10812_c0_g1~~TRINITY_DN10812_c0_g1_i2.p1  ORF type:complete len:1686 (+),score=441.68 TRINITY_DN10812_c0_g1_i2:65-5122(+)
MAPKKKAASYYKTVGGVKYDRQLLEQAEAAAADGQISVKDAKDLWKAASDGTGVTEMERRTLQYILKEMKFTEKAAEFLRKQLRQRKGSSFYKIIAGVRYDRELLEEAEEAAKDGQISLPDAKRLLERALDSGRVTETERRTLEYVLNNMKCTQPAANFLREKLGAVETRPDDPVESAAAAPEDDTGSAAERLTGESSSSAAAAPSGSHAPARSGDREVDAGVATSDPAADADADAADAAWTAASPLEDADEAMHDATGSAEASLAGASTGAAAGDVDRAVRATAEAMHDATGSAETSLAGAPTGATAGDLDGAVRATAEAMHDATGSAETSLAGAPTGATAGDLDGAVRATAEAMHDATGSAEASLAGASTGAAAGDVDRAVRATAEAMHDATGTAEASLAGASTGAAAGDVDRAVRATAEAEGTHDALTTEAAVLRAVMPTAAAPLEETEDENSPCADVADAAPGESTSQRGVVAPAATAAELPVIARLRAEAAPPSEWRREALSCHVEGRDAEFMKILEAALEDGIPFSAGPERALAMQMLAAQLVARAVAQPRPTKLEAETLLAKAKVLLDKADALLPVAKPSQESLIIKGFHALGLHLSQSVRAGSTTSDQLKLAELLFETALRSDSHSPRAILGKAVIMGQRGEWHKALDLFRRVLQQAGTPAPRTGLRLRALKELRFAMATTFSCLARPQQAKNALTAVMAADPSNVETLCALAQLSARDSAEASDQSMEHLSEAMRTDQSHPVVLCHAANHAFYCGLEDGADETTTADGNQSPAAWKMAEDLLDKAMATSKSNYVIAEIRYQRGRLRHAKGNHEDAYSEYRMCVELVPEHYACVYSLAQTCLILHRVQESIAALETVNKASPNSPEVLKLLTYAYLQSGSNEKQAVKCADALVAVSKNDIECWTMRAEAHDRLAIKQPNSNASKVVAEAYENVGKLLQEDGAAAHAASPQLWNNLGTMRSLVGDAHGAKEAYRHGLEEVKQRLQRVNGSQEESIDLQVALLTMRFNRAFLAESQPGRQDVGEAIQEYLQLSEENNWYADTLLQLGAQWQRLGKSDSAERMFQQAVKHNPFLGFLMQAEAHRSQDDFPKALKFAEQMEQQAGKTQFHYAHVYLGNLHFEAACAPMAKSKDKDHHLRNALQHFIKALQQEKDSHHAANGIGMVFAQRGKHDFAKRTFQSVMQHKAMPTNPSLYINLGHTYLGSDSGNPASVRKAIALYEQARKLKPDDVGVRLYIAKAQFLLKDYDACMTILGDATQVWPEDLLVRYNLATVIESMGANLVKEVKKKKDFGGPKDKQKMVQAVEFLDSAKRLWCFVESKWSVMTERERKFLARSAGAPDNLPKNMEEVAEHVEYCSDIAATAKDALLELADRESELRGKMQAIQDEKMQATSSEKAAQEEEDKKKADQHTEAEDQALRLMDSTREIVLGKNLESAKIDSKGPVNKSKGGKAKAKPAVNPDIAIISRDDEAQPIADALGDDDFGADPLAGDDGIPGEAIGAPGDDIGAVEDGEAAGERRGRSSGKGTRKEKKEGRSSHRSRRKDKKEREDGSEGEQKHRRRKRRRRRIEVSDEGDEEVPKGEVEEGDLFEPGEEAAPGLPLQSGEAADDSKGAEPEDDQDDSDQHKKGKKRRDRKDDKKDKKGKKEKKRRRTRRGDDDDAGAGEAEADDDEDLGKDLFDD